MARPRIFSSDWATRFASNGALRVLGLFRHRGLLDAYTVADMLTWQGTGGFSLDASVRIPGAAAPAAGACCATAPVHASATRAPAGFAAL